RVPTPSGATDTTTRASPAVRIGYGPPPRTLPAVTRVRSTATVRCPSSANRELTERTTAHRSTDTARRGSRAALTHSAAPPTTARRTRPHPPPAPGRRHTPRSHREGRNTVAKGLREGSNTD